MCGYENNGLFDFGLWLIIPDYSGDGGGGGVVANLVGVMDNGRAERFLFKHFHLLQILKYLA